MTRVIGGKNYTLSHVTSDAPGEHVEHWVDVHGRELRVGCVTREAPVEEKELTYADQRRQAYPPIGDQLDAIWKALSYLQMKKKINLVREADLLLGRILNVKKKYPKPPIVVLED